VARTFELGVVIPIIQGGPERVAPNWAGVRDQALLAEQIGFDTILSGSAEEIYQPGTMEALAALAPVAEAIHAD
jgi:hypothetical protein